MPLGGCRGYSLISIVTEIVVPSSKGIVLYRIKTARRTPKN